MRVCLCDQVLKTETENEVKFDKSYQALYRQLKDVYTKCGATDFFGVVGEDFVYARHEKVRVNALPCVLVCVSACLRSSCVPVLLCVCVCSCVSVSVSCLSVCVSAC